MSEEPDEEDGGRYASINTTPTSARDEGKLILFAAVVPFFLVMLPLTALLGSWVWSFAPILFIGGFMAFRFWQIYRDRMDSDAPLDIPGHGSYTGEAKRVLTRNAVLMLFGLTAVLLLGQLYLDDVLAWLRGALQW